MRLMEFEAKALINRHKIPMLESRIVSAGDPLDMDFPAMLKVQIPLGGRGKAGGIVEARDKAQAEEAVAKLLRSSFRGYTPNFVLVEKKADIRKEFFLACTYDTVAKLPLLIFSAVGGVDIEELAVSRPGQVVKRHFSARHGLPAYQARELVCAAGISGSLMLKLTAIITSLAEAFLAYDCTVLEINPLALLGDNSLLALDCHAEIEDEALFRHPDLAEIEKDGNRFRSETAASDFERRAAEIDRTDHRGVAGRVIEFDGDIGLIIGGGGASLTAFDAVKQHGGRPANYCEIGGNPSVRKVQALTRHILSKPGVHSISVIMNVVSNTRVDLVARGIIKGVLDAGLKPAEAIAVFRVPGAWEEEGFKVLQRYGVAICDRTVSIDQAAKKAVEQTKR
jgi:succinyl-CoA synthetase beta subunit/citryl-CoA synthetase large subunit